MDRVACITLDLEQDYGRTEAYNAFDHIEELSPIVKKYDVRLTAFVVGKVLDERHEVVGKVAQLNTDFALHSYTHNIMSPQDVEWEIKESKRAYIDYFGKSPAGYRAPQGRVSRFHFQVLKEEGFIYDSSLIPSWRPGVYANLRARRDPYYVDGLLEIPFSVISRRLRLPLIMSYMKLFPRAYQLGFNIFGLPNVVVFDFHLHDLFKTESLSKLQWKYRTFHNRNASNALGIFEGFITLLRDKGYDFVTMKELVGRT